MDHVLGFLVAVGKDVENRLHELVVVAIRVILLTHARLLGFILHLSVLDRVDGEDCEVSDGDDGPLFELLRYLGLSLWLGCGFDLQLSSRCIRVFLRLWRQ